MWLIAFTLVWAGRALAGPPLFGGGGVLRGPGLGFGLGLGLGDRGLGGVAVLEHLEMLVLGVLDRREREIHVAGRRRVALDPLAREPQAFTVRSRHLHDIAQAGSVDNTESLNYSTAALRSSC